MTQKTLTSMMIMVLIALSPSATAGVIDQRDPHYQKGVEHLASARQALAMAMEELRKADAEYAFPGLEIVRMLGAITPINQTLDLIITPEKRRLEIQVLEPDSVYFKPTLLKEN